MEREAQAPAQQLDSNRFEDLFAGYPFELVGGEVKRVIPSGLLASQIARRVAARLGDFVDERQLGFGTGADGGYNLDAKNMRAPDAAYISNEQLQNQTDLARFGEIAPDLAVEVISPHDRADEVQQKVALYFAHAVRLVWVIYPALQQAVVHHPDGTARTLSPPAELNGADVLPGFSLPLASLFSKLPLANQKPDEATTSDE